MKPFSSGLTRVVCSLLAALGTKPSATAEVDVTQHHNHASRDGLHVDPAFTQGAASLARDTNFDGAISGNVYAQPL